MGAAQSDGAGFRRRVAAPRPGTTPLGGIRPWSGLAPDVPANIQDAFDSHINEQYRTAAGSQRFSAQHRAVSRMRLLRPESSFALVQPGSDDLAGLLLCSRVREDVGHVTQICVAPEHRGQGLGRLLMVECARSLAKRGFTLLTLTVTASNRKAVSLYEWLGFRRKELTGIERPSRR